MNTLVLIWISKGLLLYVVCVSLSVFNLNWGPFFLYTFQFSGDLDFQNVIDTFITENKAKQNPTLILKRMQEIFVEGIPLEITDEGFCPVGETSFLFVDRQNLWETDSDELKWLESKKDSRWKFSFIMSTKIS